MLFGENVIYECVCVCVFVHMCKDAMKHFSSYLKIILLEVGMYRKNKRNTNYIYTYIYTYIYIYYCHEIREKYFLKMYRKIFKETCSSVY